MNKLPLAVAVFALAACEPLQLHNNNGGGNVSTGGGSGTGGSGSGGGGNATGGGSATGGGGGQTFDGGSVTWYRDVMPITQKSCVGCHTTGGIAPFSLESYDSAKPMAPSMALDVQSGKMPPWMPAASCGMSYVGDRRLSAGAIAIIKAWSDQGAPAGDPNDAPAPPDGGVGQLAWVDQTVTPANAYTPSATEIDDYHCTLIDPQLQSDRSVIGYQVIPQVRAEVHHVILYAVDRAEGQAKNVNGAGWQCFGGSGINNETFIGGWAPGSGAVEFPAGTGIPVTSNQVYVMQVHYNTSNGVRTADQTQMQLQYANTQVIAATVAPVVDYQFNVPPMAMNFTPPEAPVVTMNPYGAPIKIWGVFPHMHTHGSHITVDGSQGCLVDIPKWDFHWQQQYFFSQPITVGANDHVDISCTWNNNTTLGLQWGEGTADEMCLAFLYMTMQ